MQNVMDLAPPFTLHSIIALHVAVNRPSSNFSIAAVTMVRVMATVQNIRDMNCDDECEESMITFVRI
jgi:hypothetical protein